MSGCAAHRSRSARAFGGRVGTLKRFLAAASFRGLARLLGRVKPSNPNSMVRSASPPSRSSVNTVMICLATVLHSPSCASALLAGGNPGVAGRLAAEATISTVYAGLLSRDQVDQVRRLQADGRRRGPGARPGTLRYRSAGQHRVTGAASGDGIPISSLKLSSPDVLASPGTAAGGSGLTAAGEHVYSCDQHQQVVAAGCATARAATVRRPIPAVC
jgi:hypothetical protein